MPTGATSRPESAKPNEMPETSAQHGKSFDENIDILFDEIMLAAQWGRPSLLLAVHKSKIGQDKAEKALAARLEKQGFQVERMVINDRRSDIGQMIREATPQVKPVYFISNIDWGGGADGREAYRALNLHRELFVENAIKAVFWLTMNEASNLPRFAPDFWAFRHRVVEFISQRAAGKVQLPAGVLAWDIERSPDPFENPEGGIRAREELLGKLPDSPEALSTRIELHGGIGYLYWIMGELERAAEWFRTGLALVDDHELPELKARLLNCMGIIAYERSEHSAALDHFNQGLRYRSSSRALLINTSAANCMLGRIQEALTFGKKAVRTNPAEADTWSRLGYIQNGAGRPDEAISCFAKATELAPRAPEHRLSLAVMYSMVERPDNSQIQLRRAQELAGREGATYLDILREATIGNASKALVLLKAALTAGAITKHAIRRDPNLSLLFEPAQLEDVLV
jgi:tetratricopeptide (TPR) repeat protein